MSGNGPQWPMWVRFGVWGDATRRELGLPVHADGLTLRRANLQDVEDLWEYQSDPEVARYQLHVPATRDELGAQIEYQLKTEAGTQGVPVLVAVEYEGRVIGECGLTVTNREDRQGVLGYQFHPSFTGRDFATRAVRITLGLGFRQLGLHRIVAETDVRNERSRRLLERVGLRREAHFRHDQFVKGEWVDSYLYAILDHEWPSDSLEASKAE